MNVCVLKEKVNTNSYAEVENIIGYKFKNINLLVTALSHKSYAVENNVNSYEKFEFLGDRLMNFIISDLIFNLSECLNLKEGDMSIFVSKFTSSSFFGNLIKQLGLDNYVLFGKGVDKTKLGNKVYADVLESVMCAIYLDGGLESVKRVLSNLIKNFLITFLNSF